MAKVYDNATDLITFARSSSATYLDSDGVLKTAAADAPRIEYGSDGSLKGLLIEEQRTNYITSSQSLTVGVDGMFKSAGGTVTNNAGTFLDGSNDAVRIDFSVPGACGVQRSVTSGHTYTFSFFAKPISVPGDWYITTQGSAGIFSKNIAADLVTDEWVRVHLTFTAAATTTQQFRFVSDNEVEAYICGAQLEVGSFATSYIPTSGSQSTRSPDIASIPVSAFGYNQSAGTVVVEASSNYSPQSMVPFSLGNFGDGVWVAAGSGVGSEFACRTASVTQFSIDVGSTVTGTFHKTAGAYKENDAAASFDGSPVGTDPSVTVPSVSTAYIGTLGGSTSPLNGHIKSLSYFPRRLTNAQLQELTA